MSLRSSGLRLLSASFPDAPIGASEGALLREPGIHNHQSGLWIPGLRPQSAIADWKAHPGMTLGDFGTLSMRLMFSVAAR